MHDLKELAKKLNLLDSTGEVNTEYLQSLSITSPKVFEEIKNRADDYKTTPGQPIPAPIVENIIRNSVQNEFARHNNFQMSRNGFTAIQGIAQLTQSVELNKVATLGVLSVDFTEQYQNLQSAIINGGDAASFANPIVALTNIGVKVLMQFLFQSGPTVEEIMLKQLEQISKQITDLHNAMLREFNQIHKHLELLHQSLHSCHSEMKVLITNQIAGFRYDSITRLKTIESNLDFLFGVISVGQRELLLQDLIKLGTDVTGRLEKHKTLDEAVEVQRIARELELNWILNQSGSSLLSGKVGYIPGRGNAAHLRDISVFKNTSPQYLGDIMGYITQSAIEYGLDPSGINLADIFNLSIFTLTVRWYLQLRGMYPNLIKDDAPINKLEEMLLHSESTYKVLSRIQKSKVLFENLFADYQQASIEATAALEAQVQKANRDLHEQDISTLIDLHLDFEKHQSLFAGMFPKNTEATAHVLPTIDLKWFGCYANFDFPVHFLIAEALQLGSINTTYIALSGISFQCQWGFSNNATVIQMRRIQLRNYPGTDPSQALERRYDYKPKHLHSYMRHIFTFAYVQQQPTSEATLNAIEHGCSAEIYLEGKQPTHLFIKGSGVEPDIENTDATVRDSNKIKSHVKKSTFLRVENADNTASLDALKREINKCIVEHRKNLVATPLLNNESEHFNTALQHLDAARQRLMVFAFIAECDPYIFKLIRLLPSSKSIKHELSYYNLNGKTFSRPCTIYTQAKLKYIKQVILNEINSRAGRPLIMGNLMGQIEQTRVSLHMFNLAYKRYQQQTAAQETREPPMQPNYRYPLE